MSSHDEHPLYSNCDICQMRKRCGPHLYEGSGVPAWGMWVCNYCRLTDDVPPVFEFSVMKILDAKGISYRRNKSGFIIIPR